MEFHKVIDIIEKPISGEWGDEPEQGDESLIKVIRTTNFMNDGRLDFKKDVVLRKIGHDIVKNKKLIHGDIIIEKSGGSPSQPVGRVVYFDNEDGNYLCNNFTSILRAKDGVYSKYLLYFLLHQHLSGKTLKFQNKTTGIINLQLKNYLEALVIPLPAFEIQRKISDVMDKARILIDKRKEQIEKLEEFIRSVFLDMFGDPIINQHKWMKLTLPGLVNTDKYSIKRGPFGGSLKKECFVNDGYLVYEQYHAINEDFSMARYFISGEKYEELSAFQVHPGDLIISCSGTLGKIAEIPAGAKEGIINQALLKLSINDKVMSNCFFKFLFRNEKIQDILFGVSRGSGIANFPPMDVVKSIEFICPPLELQNKFAAIVQKTEQQRKLLQRSLVEMENSYSSLMQRAFNYQLYMGWFH